MIGSPNGANISAAVPTPTSTASAGPSTAVTGIGTASVIHHVSTQASTAANRCAAGDSDPAGSSSAIRNSPGPRKRPIVRRRRSNRSSPGESVSFASNRSRNRTRSLMRFSLPRRERRDRLLRGVPLGPSCRRGPRRVRWACWAAWCCGRQRAPARLRASPVDGALAVALQGRSSASTHASTPHTHACFYASSSPRATVTAWPPRTTRSPATRTHTAPPRADAW